MANSLTNADGTNPQLADSTGASELGLSKGGGRSVPRIAVGEVFGRYKLLEQLGRGGMGNVYTALDLQLDRTVALKIPNLGGKDASKRLKRFFREAKAAAALSHPNLCQIYDVGEVGGVHFLTMEHVDGKSLSTLMKGGKRFSSRQVAQLIRRLAKAMEVAHRAGVYHRDLKPSNIVIDQAGKPVIVDFGLAWREQGDDPRVTKDGSSVGTPAFMSPEQIQHGMQAAGAASDIYSLGVTFYVALTGRLPFAGEAPGVYVRIVNEVAVPPSQHNPKIPGELEEICLKAMAKDPGQRFASMEELANALGDLLSQWPSDMAVPIPKKPDISAEVRASPDVAAEFARKNPQRDGSKRSWFPRPSVWATVLVGLLGGGALAYWGRGNNEQPTPSVPADSNETQVATAQTGLSPAVPEPEPLPPAMATQPAVVEPSTETVEPAEPMAVKQVDDGAPQQAVAGEIPADQSQPPEMDPQPAVVQEPVAPSRKPEEILAEVGLVKLSRSYSLSLESEFADRLRSLNSIKGEVRQARDALTELEKVEKAREAKVYASQKEWHELEPLQEQALSQKNARRYNQIVTKRNQLATEIKKLQEQADTRALDAARHTLSQAVSRYQEQLLELRQLADRIQVEYEKLQKDEPVHAAVKSLTTGAEGLPIEASRPFLRGLREFEELEHELLRWEVPVVASGSKWLVQVRLNDQLTVEMEYAPNSRWTLIPLPLAARLGLRPSASDPKVSITLPDGTEYQGTKMRLEAVRVGPSAAANVECIVLPEAFDDSTPKLGVSFLQYFMTRLLGEKLLIEPLDESLADGQVKRGSQR